MSPFPGDSCNADECLSTRVSRTAPLEAGFDGSGKGSLKMKTKLFFSLLLLSAAVAPCALAATDAGDKNVHTGRGQLLVTPVDDPAVKNVPPSPTVVPNDPKQVLRDYDSLMIALTQKFSATLVTIAEAAKRGELSSEQRSSAGRRILPMEESGTPQIVALSTSRRSRRRRSSGSRWMRSICSTNIVSI